MIGLLNEEEFEREFDIRSWHASSGNIKHVHSAIVNIRLQSDRRRVKKVYIYFNHELNHYVTEETK